MAGHNVPTERKSALPQILQTRRPLRRISLKQRVKKGKGVRWKPANGHRIAGRQFSAVWSISGLPQADPALQEAASGLPPT
jgi:hypothetical protein